MDERKFKELWKILCNTWHSVDRWVIVYGHSSTLLSTMNSIQAEYSFAKAEKYALYRMSPKLKGILRKAGDFTNKDYVDALIVAVSKGWAKIFELDGKVVCIFKHGHRSMVKKAEWQGATRYQGIGGTHGASKS